MTARTKVFKGSKGAIIISVSVFIMQIAVLSTLSIIYPSNQFRTGLLQGITYKGVNYNGFLTDPVSYPALIAFPIAFILKSRLDKLWKSFSKAKREKENADKFENLIKEWEINFDIKIPVLITILTYALLLIFLRTFGTLFSVEPFAITLTWALDDILGIFSTVWVTYSGFKVAKFLATKLIRQDFARTLDIYDKMGGWKDIGNLNTMNSMMIGLTNGIWLVPWILFGVLRGLALPLSPVEITFLDLLGIIASVGTIVIPIGLFAYSGLALARVIRACKESVMADFKLKLHELHESIMDSLKTYDSQLNTLKNRADYLISQIERIERIQEWPIDTKNIGVMISSVILQVIEIFLWYIFTVQIR